MDADAPNDRTIPNNDHVWDDLTQLTASVRAFKLRTADRRAAFLAGAEELAAVEAKADAILHELANLDGREAGRAS